MELFWTLMLATLAVLARTSEGQECDTSTPYECFVDFNAAVPTGFDYTNMQFGGLVGNFESVCSAFDDVVECIGSSFSGCDTSTRLTWEAEIAGFDYLCSAESRENLGHFVSCIGDLDVLADLLSCTDTFIDAGNSLTSMSGICGILESYAKCIVGSARRRCTSEAAQWWAGYLDASFQPYKDEYNCIFTAGADTYKVSVLVLVLATVLNYAVTE